MIPAVACIIAAMMMLATTIGYAVLVAIVTLLLRRLRPAWRDGTIVCVASLAIPLVVMILATIGVASILVKTPPAEEIDASGMAMMVYMIGGSVLAAATLAIGLAASLFVVRQLRPPQPPSSG